MAYNATALVRLAALKALAEKTKAEIDNINTDVSKAIKSLGVSGNTVSFYTSADKSGTAAFTFDFRRSCSSIRLRPPSCRSSHSAPRPTPALPTPSWQVSPLWFWL